MSWSGPLLAVGSGVASGVGLDVGEGGVGDAEMLSVAVDAGSGTSVPQPPETDTARTTTSEAGGARDMRAKVPNPDVARGPPPVCGQAEGPGVGA